MAAPVFIKEFFGRISGQGVTSSGNDVGLLAEDDGTLQTSLYGTDVSGNLDPLRTNTNQQLQVEIVGSTGTSKILGVSDPAATTNTNLYTVPASKSATIDKFWAVNRGTATITIRVGFDIGGAGTNAPGDAEWLFYDFPLEPNQTLIEPGNILMATTDDFVVYTDISDASFGITGMEIDA